MAQVKAGKKIKAAFKTFQQQKTKRVKAVTGAVTDIIEARQAGRSSRAASRAAGKVGKSQAVAAGGGFIGRQQAIGQIGTGFIKAGTAAATGGASLAGGVLGDLLGGSGRGDMAFDTGSGQVVSALPPEKPFYTQPIFLIGAAGLAALLLLRPRGRNGRR